MLVYQRVTCILCNKESQSLESLAIPPPDVFFLGDASNNLGSGFLGSPGRWNAQKRKAGTTRAQFTFQVRDGLGRNLGWLMCSWLNHFKFGLVKSSHLLVHENSVCLFVCTTTRFPCFIGSPMLVGQRIHLMPILATDISQLMPISRYFFATNLSLFYCNQLDCWRVLPPFWFPAGNST